MMQLKCAICVVYCVFSCFVEAERRKTISDNAVEQQRKERSTWYRRILSLKTREKEWASDGEGFFCLRHEEEVVCEVQAVGTNLQDKEFQLFPFWGIYNPFSGHEDGLFFNEVPFTRWTGNSTEEVSPTIEAGDILTWNLRVPSSYGFYLQVADDLSADNVDYYYSDPYLNNPSGTRTFTRSSPYNNTGVTLLEFFQPGNPSDVMLALDCQGMVPMAQVENLWEQSNHQSISSLAKNPVYQRVVDTIEFAGSNITKFEEQPLENCAEDNWVLQMWLDERRDIPVPLTDTTHNQQIIRACLLMISGIASVLSSGYLVFAISVRYYSTGFTAVRDRLILMMSCVDILNSLCLACGPFLSPSDSNIDMIGSNGSHQSCRFQGFGIQLGFGVPAYNVMLCVYYISAILGGRDEASIRRKQEWWMQSIPLVYALSTAVAGLLLDLYHSNGTFCWIEAYPKNCSWNGWHDCLAGENATTFVIAFAGGPLVGFFVMIVLCMVLLIRALRSTALQARRNIAIQAILYIASFCLTYIWGVVISLCILLEIPMGFWAHALNSLFLPLQGFWNVVIFLRPTVQRMRQRDPKSWWYKLLWKAAMQESVNFRAPSRPRRRPSQFARSSLRFGTRPPSRSVSFQSSLDSPNGEQDQLHLASSIGYTSKSELEGRLAKVEESLDELSSSHHPIELSAEDVEWPLDSPSEEEVNAFDFDVKEKTSTEDTPSSSSL